jgi:hypothetical protein
MNERIRELYIQTANETADGKEWAIGGMKNAERFAALIVRECIQIAQNELVLVKLIDKQTHMGVRDYFLGSNCGINESIHSIKLHFGIEE